MNKLDQQTGFCEPNDWRRFVEYIRHSNRFVLTEYWHQFFDGILQTSQSRLATIQSNSLLIRARIGITWIEEEDGGKRPSPYSPRNMGPPPKQDSTEGRLNPPGIPYLYLASDPDTAIAEVRPWIGAELTVGKFRVTRQLKVVDTSLDKPRLYPELQFVTANNEITDVRERENATYSENEKEQQIWGDINSAFSEPMSPAESHLTYLPTQYLAEVLKVKGFDGVKYRSSLNPKGYNVALFDPADAVCFSCRQVQVLGVNYDWEDSGNPVSIA